jgi:hypothetical protein
MPTTKMVVPFIRQEVDGIKTLALVQFTVTRPLTQKALVNALTKLITKWVKDTQEGKDAWEQSNGDYNIGDYALTEVTFGNSIPHAELTKHGIQNIEIIYNGEVDGAELYDRVLVDTNSL